VSLWRVAARGWRIHVPVVVANALVQAATTLPFLTPAASASFILLTLASFAALAAAAALVAAQAAASAGSFPFRWPSWTLWMSAAIVVLLVGTGSLISPFVVPVACAVAIIVLTGAAARPSRPFAAFRLFANAPLRAIGLSLLTLVVLGLLWVVALLLGLFVTGALGSGLTWLVFGAVAVVLIAAWTESSRRHL